MILQGDRIHSSMRRRPRLRALRSWRVCLNQLLVASTAELLLDLDDRRWRQRRLVILAVMRGVVRAASGVSGRCVGHIGDWGAMLACV
eukprot:968340-Pleurochrysis_carterae.AAC.1